MKSILFSPKIQYFPFYSVFYEFIQIYRNFNSLNQIIKMQSTENITINLQQKDAAQQNCIYLAV